MKFADLHMHTRYSDGEGTVEDVVAESIAHGLEVIAIADHDNLAWVDRCVDVSAHSGLLCLPAVEVTTDRYHVLGYCVDTNNAELQHLLMLNQWAQTEQTRQRLQVLRRMGYPVSFEDLRRAYPESRLNKRYIAKYMSTNESLRLVANPLTSELLGDMGEDRILKEIVTQAHRDGQDPPELSAKYAIEGIIGAGGIPVIAHPFKQVRDISEIDILRGYGLVGIENEPHYGERNDPFMEYAHRHGMLVTFGSDYHGRDRARIPILGRGANLVTQFWEQRTSVQG